MPLSRRRSASSTDRTTQAGDPSSGGEHRAGSNASRLEALKSKGLGKADGVVDAITDWTCVNWGLACGPGARVDDGGSVTLDGVTIGPFAGEWEGRSRAQVIADRLTERGRVTEPVDVEVDGPVARASDQHGDLFTVTPGDALAGGFLEPLVAAWTWVSALSGAEIPEAVLAASEGRLTEAETAEILAYRSNGVTAESNGTILVHGIRIGPFDGKADAGDGKGERDRSGIVAERLAAMRSAELRSAVASGAEVTVAGKPVCRVTTADAAGMTQPGEAALSVEDAAVRVQDALRGTWVMGDMERQAKGDEATRRVIPESCSEPYLYEIALAVATGPGRSDVDADPLQVTLVSMRGIGLNGVYDPRAESVDDTVVAIWRDAGGGRRATRFGAVMDPHSMYGGDASQVGDDAHDYRISTINNDWHKLGGRWGTGTVALQPLGTHLGSDSIETRSAHGDRDLDQQTGSYSHRTDTKIHLGGGPTSSAGCTVIVDDELGSDGDKAGRTRGHEIAAIDPSKLDAALRAMSGPELRALLASPDGQALDSATQERVRVLAELREAEQARDEGVSLDRQTSIPTFEAFMSICYRDPDVTIRNVIVDGSKIASFTGGA